MAPKKEDENKILSEKVKGNAVIGYFFNEELEPRIRIQAAVILTVMIGVIVTLVPMILGGVGIWQDVVILVFCLAAMVLQMKYHHPGLAGMILSVSITFIMLPAMYFTQGGMHSAMCLWFVVCAISSYLIVPPQYQVLMLICNVAVGSACLIIEHFCPSLVTPLAGEDAVFSDILIGYVLTTLVTAFILAVYIRTERRQRTLLEEQKKELEEKQDQLKNSLGTDPLTGIENRYSYNKRIAELNRDRLPDDLILVSTDVNGLKQVNDSLGHEIGDELIRGAAEVMTKAFSPYGKVYRIGGDEFQAVIRTDKTTEELQAGLEHSMNEWRGDTLKHITISAGYARNSEIHADSCIDLQRTADRNMYEAKSEYYRQRGFDRRTR